MKNLILFLLIGVFASCKNSASSDKETKNDTTKPATNTTSTSSKKFTTACDALTIADVKRIFGLKIDDNYVPSTEKYGGILRCEYSEESKYVSDPFKKKKITIDIQDGENLNLWVKTDRNAGALKKNYEISFYPAAGDSSFYSYFEMDLGFHTMSTKFAFQLNNQVITVYGHQIPKDEFYGTVPELYSTIKGK